MSPVSKNTTGQLICETAATVWLSLSVSRPMHACVMVPDTARSTNQTSTFTPLPFIVFHMTSLMWDVRCVPRCANWHEMATSSYWINLSQIRLSKLCFYVMDNFCPYWGGGVFYLGDSHRPHQQSPFIAIGYICLYTDGLLNIHNFNMTPREKIGSIYINILYKPECVKILLLYNQWNRLGFFVAVIR